MLSIETGEVTQLTSPGAPQFDRLRGYGAGRKDLGVSTLSGPSECLDSDAPYPDLVPRSR